MADQGSSIWDNLGNLLDRVAGGYLDLQVAKSNADAARETRMAEDQRASMIDQLTRQFALGANTAGNYVGSLPAWVIPAAVIGGGLLIFKKVKFK